jgi:predicted N-acetyltransferase YhbS
VIKYAFQKEKYSDQKEHLLVDRLRKSKEFIPELSLVAEKDDQLVGYILLSKVTIHNELKTFDSLALAPVVVLPEYQKQGIGRQLIEAVHTIAHDMGFSSIVVLGHESYYPKFGYCISEEYGITFPFEAPRENCMVLELRKDALKNVSGTIHYPEEFFQ